MTDKSKRNESVPDQAWKLLQKAVEQAERAGNIIQHMRRFLEKREPLRTEVDLNPLVDDTVELTLFGHGPSVRVVRTLASDLPRIAVDAVQIQQVLVNLLSNAFDAVKTEPSPEVNVATSLTDHAVQLTVKDNGPGISPNIVPHIFEAFSTSKKNGLGLGLAISRTIAQSHGGDLSVEPSEPGRGARFTLKLPRKTLA